MTSEKRAGRVGGVWAAIGGGLVALVGLVLLAGGVWLVALRGSPYYALAGLGVLATGVLLVRRRPLAGLVYAVVLAGSLAWALWESGFAFWPLLPRLFAPAVLGLLVLLVLLAVPRGRLRGQAMLATGLASLALLAVLGASIPGAYSHGQAETAAQSPAKPLPAAAGGDWRYYGRDPGGARFGPFDQINTENVDELKVAWTFRTGEKESRGSQDQNTPTQIGDTLYLCTPTNVVIAVEADTGAEKWRHDPKVKPGGWNRCRGVGYYETASVRGQPAGAPAALCDRRIITSTIDARLMALDAATGQLCPGFGQGGVVDLKAGMGEVKPGFYFPTSTPTVAGDRIVIGGWVMDNRELNEPPGVVRAFHAETGELVWAWDLGNPAVTKLPPEGQSYTRGTPNVWSTPAFDEALGLVYLPTGNATPDYWGSHRSRASEAYSSSVVALDLATGRERWKFQTVHHDIWDYDVPSQPMLADVPVPGGGTAPALIQLTKRGQIFVLDRRTGQPIARVEEKPVPQGGVQPGEWVSPTQPYSTGMPEVNGGRLTEARMWGVSPLDQLACRIAFRKLRYEGEFTPPGSKAKPNLQFPGNAGGQNWGSGAYDAARDLLIVPEIRLPITVYLERSDRPQHQPGIVADRPPQSQNAVAYRSRNERFMGPAEAPCLEPPHGTLTAIDMRTRKIVWQVPAGSAENLGPYGMRSGLKVPVGTFGIGGPVATAGGVVFHASTTDPYLRAYDVRSGKLIWQGRLPVGAGGTPMTFVSPKSGKQYVVVSAGGARQMPEKGDYVIAYALP